MSNSMSVTFLDWMVKNQEKLALDGLLDKKAGYGLRRVQSGGQPTEKSAAVASMVRRDNATTILGRYITKMAATAPAVHVGPLKKAHAALLAGDNINTAMAQAYPAMQPEQRGRVAHTMAKRAMTSYLDDAGFGKLSAVSSTTEKRKPRVVGRTEHTGSPDSATEWMRKQTAAMS